MENHFKDSFVKYYHSDVRPLAAECAKGYNAMVALENGDESVKETPEGKICLECVDPHAIWFIGIMISEIDRALIKGIRIPSINSLSQVNSCLNDKGYWTNLWKDDYSSEEAKKLRELANKTKELVSLL